MSWFTPQGLGTAALFGLAAATAVFACSSEEPEENLFSPPPGRTIGDDDDDEPGNGSSGVLPPPVEASTLSMVRITAGTFHTCVLWSDGILKCWGENANGQLGLGDVDLRGATAESMGKRLPAVNLGNGARTEVVGAGGRQTCAILAGGAVKCWGHNDFGGLGQPDMEPRGTSPETMGDALLPIDLGSNRLARDLGVGDFSTCALLNDGTVKCWGSNFGGELGYGDELQRGGAPADPEARPMGDALPPVDVGLSDIQTVRMTSAVVYQSGCGLSGSGTVKCWGGNNYGQLGLGDQSARGDDVNEMGGQLPLVPVGGQAVFLALGHDALCVGLDTGLLRCWGNNQYGKLGQGDTALRGHDGNNLPLVNLGATSKVVSASMYDHACAVFEDRSLKCWGRNDHGQLGLGDLQNRGDLPGQMSTALPAVDFGEDTPLEAATGEHHTCIRFASHKVKCWGDNQKGQLGYGDTTPRGGSAATMGDNLPYLDLGR